MKIALCGFYAKQNFGDDLMAHHLSKILSVNGTHSVHLFSDKSAESIENGLLTESHILCDVVVIGGGGIVNPDFWAFKKGGIDKLKYSGKPIAFVNVNVTQDILKNQQFIEDIKALKAKWWVRTRQSADILAQVGIASTVVPDVSFRANVVPKKHSVNVNKKLSVFLNSYVFNDLTNNNDVNQFLQALQNIRIIAGFCDWLTDFGWNITFYAAHTAKSVDDRIPSALAFGTMKNKHNAQWISEPMSWDKLVLEISSSDMILSMRFHSTTCALASNVPCIDITHHAKNKSLIDEINVSPMAVEYSSLTHDSLVKAAQYVENSSSYISKVSDFCSESLTRWDLFDSEWSTFMKNLEMKNNETPTY
jgi:polysaccharide pyruvyl transferase WcaK-like protein